MDIRPLEIGLVDTIDISGKYSLDLSLFQSDEILDLSELDVHGFITRKENDDLVLEDYIQCSIQGIMTILDSISLEKVEYPFQAEYDDFLYGNWKNNENSLDIFAFLWENTVLEVPLQFTKVRDLSKFQGDGWRLIREEDRVKEDNPFTDLLKDFEEE